MLQISEFQKLLSKTCFVLEIECYYATVTLRIQILSLAEILERFDLDITGHKAWVVDC